MNDFDKNKLNKMGIGVSSVCNTNGDTNIDYTLTDDVLLAGGSICYVEHATWGDSVSLQILSGVTVLAEFLTNWPINPNSTQQQMPTSSYPARLFGGLTVRAVYHSVSESTAANIAIGYNFEKILV